MWNLARVEVELNKLSEVRGDKFSIPVKINGRLTRTLGRVTQRADGKGGHYPILVEFSKQLLETATDESIVDVIKHEWCHYYITKTTGKNHGHDKAFKQLCALIGTSGETSTKVERTVEVKNKYDMFCSDCGKLLGGYSRMCKTLKQIDAKAGITSKCCGSEVNYTKNW